MTRYAKRYTPVPPSTASPAYPGRTPHWIRPNAQERIPHRWIVADSESHRVPAVDGECQTLRLAVAVRWRDDLKSGDGEEWLHTKDALDFWKWVTEWTWSHGRTCLAFHNAAHDLGILDAFTILPVLGWELVWCNLDRDVSVVTWRGPGGTLVIWDTYSWLPTGLAKIGPMVGIDKPPLPDDDDSDAAWWHRCESDVAITTAAVRELLAFVRTRHLGNWQPSGAGMGHTTWRHQHYTHKVLVHDDQAALAAEREAMWAGRAEAWWHGTATGGPFTEWDMHSCYPRIASECLLPTKLWDHDPAPSRRVHEWALEHWRVLARVTVRTSQPVVPCSHGGRIIWPVGEFGTYLWDNELALLRRAGGKYRVHEQWRYTRKPCLQSWADWTLAMQASDLPEITPVAKTWVKHQGRAVIGRMGLRTPTWEEWGPNWMPAYTGMSLLSQEGEPVRRLMHVGRTVWCESDRAEAQQSVPQITSWIMAEARCRLWDAATAAGLENVLHTDTDSLIVTKAGDERLAGAAAAGLPGHWRRKDTWRALEITGPRHYETPQRRQVPGVPRTATKRPDGAYEGEIWDSLAHALTEGRTGERRIRNRTWHPAHVDHRRPYQGEDNGPATPIRLPAPPEETHHE